MLTAEKLAEATRKQLRGTTHDASLECTQALLLLGFYEWTDLKGQKGFRTLRSAISNAQALGYQHLDEPRRRVGAAGSTKGSDQEDDFIDREIERRTFWSCFIMDRYVGCGKTRPSVLNVEDTYVQLPCSDNAWMCGQKVKTRFLSEKVEKTVRQRQKSDFVNQSSKTRDRHHHDDHSGSEDDETQWEVGKREGELSLYIRAVEHFGNVMKWATLGGRRCVHWRIYLALYSLTQHRNEGKVPPWDPDTGFYHLEKSNKQLKQALPRLLVLTSQNTKNKIGFRTTRSYLLIHAMHTLCTIALYREYMAFCPFSVKVPDGPLDEPKIDEKPPEDKKDYWIKQADDCFRAAREFFDLIEACHQAHALVDIPIVGWATYIVAWCSKLITEFNF